MNLVEDLVPFKEICRKISLNIPDCSSWQWDADRDMAMVILEEEDAEMVFFPLFKEFEHHWNFTSQACDADPVLIEYVNDNFGLMPGQAFFTTYPLCNIVLGVAWWPWGSHRKISMRVGLIPVKGHAMDKGLKIECLRQWLNITEDL